MAERIDTLSNLIRKLFRSEELSSNEFMDAYKAAFELSVTDMNNEVIEVLFDVCYEYIRETQEGSGTLLKTCVYMETHPIIELTKDVNSYIVKVLKRDVERYVEGRHMLYKKYVSYANRIVSFLNRFHMPNGTNRNLNLLYRDNFYEFKPSIDLMLFDMWKEFFP